MSEDVAGLLARVAELESDIKAMRSKNRSLESEAKERDEILGPALEAQRRELVRDKGFDPASTEGKRLVKAMVDGEVEGDGSNLVEVAKEGFGYEPTQTRSHHATDAELAYQYFADRGVALNSVTYSDSPATDSQAISEAEAEGDWDKARYLKSRQLANHPNISQ